MHMGSEPPPGAYASKRLHSVTANPSMSDATSPAIPTAVAAPGIGTRMRRWLVGGGSLDAIVSEAMTAGGLTLNAESRAIEAKEILMKRKITAAPVVDDSGKLCGAINLQDFYQAGII